MTGPLSTHLGLVGIEVGDIIGVTTCWGPSPRFIPLCASCVTFSKKASSNLFEG